MSRGKFKGLKKAACMLPLIMASEAFAQLEEIIVTAQKRNQSLQDVGIAVTAFSGDHLDLLNIGDSKEILLRVPNMDIIINGPNLFANVFLRGVGGRGLDSSNSVGVYVDEVVIEHQAVNLLQTFDMERVESLAGPQNTLYGRNTTGGAVNYITKKPEIGGEANGYLTVGYGRFDKTEVDVAYGAPIGDKAAYRLAGSFGYMDDYVTNRANGEEIGGSEEIALRAQVDFQPTDKTHVRLKAHYEEVDSDLAIIKQVGDRDPNDPTQPCATPFELGRCVNANGFGDSDDQLEVWYNKRRPAQTVDAGGLSAHVTIDFDNFTLTSITAFEQSEVDYNEDSDATESSYFDFHYVADQEQFSQEFRLSSTADGAFRWHVGAFAFWENRVITPGPIFLDPADGPFVPEDSFLVSSEGDHDITNYSSYVDFEYDLSEKFTLKTGFRVGQDNWEGQARALFASQSQLGIDIFTTAIEGGRLPDFDRLFSAAEAAGAGTIVLGGPTDPDANINDTSWEEWGAKFGLDYKISEDVLVYGQWSRGYKGGSFNTAPMSLALGLADTPLEPETVDTYEAGLKSEYAGGRVRLNAAVFFNDFANQQLSQFIGGDFLRVSVDSEIFGAEATLDWVPTDNTYISVSLGYLDAEVTESNANGAEEGNGIPGTPEFNFKFSLRQDWEVENGKFGAILDGRYVAERWYDLVNTFESPDYFVMNLTGFYEFGPEDKYRVSVFGRNITDELYHSNGFVDFAPGSHAVYVNMPPTWGIQGKINF